MWFRLGFSGLVNRFFYFFFLLFEAECVFSCMFVFGRWALFLGLFEGLSAPGFGREARIRWEKKAERSSCLEQSPVIGMDVIQCKSTLSNAPYAFLIVKLSCVIPRDLLGCKSDDKCVTWNSFFPLYMPPFFVTNLFFFSFPLSCFSWLNETTSFY